MKKITNEGNDMGLDDLDQLIEEITVDAYTDEEKLWAFRQTFEDSIAVPCDGFVMGEPVTIVEFDYEGNERRGLTARCRREDGSEHIMAVADVSLSPRTSGARFIAAYRQWLGLDPTPHEVSVPPRRTRQHKVQATDLELSGPVELVVLSVKSNSARCRPVGSDRTITLRATLFDNIVPGEIITVKPRKQWNYSGHPYLSGEIESSRLDVTALGLVPLRLEDLGLRSPDELNVCGEDESIEDLSTAIVDRSSRHAFEMGQILPGMKPDQFDSDPISDANDLLNGGERQAATKILMELCQADLRCLDAHAHLGNFIFEYRPEDAIRYYEVGVRIGELSLGPDFDGLLLWLHIDNRPFLRCLHGFGLCLWRLRRFEEAEQVFGRMLRLNPLDNQGVRFMVTEIRAKKTWEQCRESRMEKVRKKRKT